MRKTGWNLNVNIYLKQHSNIIGYGLQEGTAAGHFGAKFNKLSLAYFDEVPYKWLLSTRKLVSHLEGDQSTLFTQIDTGFSTPTFTEDFPPLLNKWLVIHVCMKAPQVLLCSVNTLWVILTDPNASVYTATTPSQICVGI